MIALVLAMVEYKIGLQVLLWRVASVATVCSDTLLCCTLICLERFNFFAVHLSSNLISLPFRPSDQPREYDEAQVDQGKMTIVQGIARETGERHCLP